MTLHVDGMAAVSALADIGWQDLRAAGIGDGNHGFRLCLPASHAVLGERQGWVQVDRLTRRLAYRGNDTFPVPPPLIAYVAAHVVNNCNLRCPFCMVDYSEVKKTELMTQETFRGLLELASLVPEAGFLPARADDSSGLSRSAPHDPCRAGTKVLVHDQSGAAHG